MQFVESLVQYIEDGDYAHAEALVERSIKERLGVVNVLREGSPERTCLFVAARAKQAKMARLLLYTGADHKVVNDAGASAAHFAAMSKPDDSSCMEVLVNVRANVNLPDHLGFTPLHYACQHGNVVIAKYLARTSCFDVFETTIAGQTAGDFATLSGVTSELPQLFHASGSMSTQFERFIHACEYELISMIRNLLAKGVDVNATSGGFWNRTPVHVAVAKQRVEAVEILCQAKANVNVADSRGSLPIHTAASGLSKEIVIVLMGAGADVNAFDSDGFSPLMLAAERNSCQIVKALLDCDALKVDATSPKNSKTALMVAMERRADEVASMV